MSTIEWRGDLAVGGEIPDDEHRRLMDLLARAQAAYAAGNVRLAVRLLRQFLVDFDRHFDDEQRRLSLAGCPAVHTRATDYRTAHAIFSVHPLEPDDVEVIGQMIDYARAWLLDHVIRQDMPLAGFLAGKRAERRRLGMPKLRWRIALLALVPLVALAGVVAASVWEMERNAASMRLMARMNHLNTRIGDVVHELQHERGLATLFLTDRRLGRAELDAQFARTNLAAAELHEAVAHIEDDITDGGVRDRLTNALIALSLVEEVRDDLREGSYDAVETVDFYTTAIEDLAVVAPDVVRTVLTSDFAKLTFAQILLQQAKEIAGRERAAGIAILSGATPELASQSVRDLGSEQRALGESFIAMAPGDLAAAYRAADHVAEMPMDWMRRNLESGDIDKVSAQEWFDATTHRIDAFRAVETEVAARLAADADALDDRSRGRLLLLGTGMVALALVSVAMMLGLGWTILTPLIRLAKAVRRLADGDRLVAIPELDSHDELGGFARSLQLMKERLVHGDLLEARRLTTNAERLRVVADNTPGVVFRVQERRSGSPVVVCASRKLREVVGLAPTEMVDKPLWKVLRQLCRPEDWAGLLRILQMTGHRTLNFEFRLRGGERWLRVAASPYPTEQGWVWDGVVLDVTALKAAERERGRMAEELARLGHPGAPATVPKAEGEALPDNVVPFTGPR
ncbi:MAG: nitrate- and nitrite sensing domain-containing protein [Pseudomonadota bacterium]